MIAISPIGYPTQTPGSVTTIYVASLVVEGHVTAGGVCIGEIIDS